MKDGPNVKVEQQLTSRCARNSLRARSLDILVPLQLLR